MVERLPVSSGKVEIVNKYAILSDLNIDNVQKNPERFKKYIKRHKVMSHIHGTGEAVVGALFLFMISHLKSSNQATLATYSCLGSMYVAMTYITVEGAWDMISGQRKHDLSSTIIEKMGMRNLNYNLSVPRTSELKKLID